MIYDPAVQGLLLKAKDLTLKAKANDLTFKAKAKDSKFVLEDTSRPRTKAKDNNTDAIWGADSCKPKKPMDEGAIVHIPHGKEQSYRC